MNLWRKSLAIAWPVMLANIITPLIGLVDAALMGRMPSPAYAAAVGVATVLIGYVVFGCNFLSFSMSGLSANAKGRQQPNAAAAVWQQHALIAVAIGSFIAVSQFLWRSPLLIALQLAPELVVLAEQYLAIRLMNAPIILLNLTFIGFFIGQGMTRANLLASVTAQVINLLLSAYLVLVLQLGVTGVAIGSIVAEVVMSVIYTWQLRRWAIQQNTRLLVRHNAYLPLRQIGQRSNALWLRGLILTTAVASLPWFGARLGNEDGAAITIVLNLFLLSSSLLDGFAQSTEAQLGAAIDHKKTQQNRIIVVNALLMTALCLLIIAGFWLAQPMIISLMTQVGSVQITLQNLWLLLLLMILAGSTAFFLDGVFIALNRVRYLRDAVVFPAIFFYFPALLLVQTSQQLLASFTAFLALRSLWLANCLRYARKNVN